MLGLPVGKVYHDYFDASLRNLCFDVPSLSSVAASLGKALRSRREALGNSQEGFADEVGMHRTYYSAIERGEKNLQLDTLQRLSAGLDTPIWELFRDAESGC